MLNQSHPLYQLADKIDWGKFETTFQPLYCQDNGLPGKPNPLNLRDTVSEQYLAKCFLRDDYLITKIGVLEWKIIRRAMLGLNKRAKTFRL